MRPSPAIPLVFVGFGWRSTSVASQTLAASIPGFDATSWHGVFAPAGTPKPVVDQLAADVKQILEQPAVQKTLTEVGAVPSPMSPEEFSKFIAAERTKWREVVKAAGVTAQ